MAVTRLDDDAIWLFRELETIESNVFEKKYPDIIYPRLLPVDFTTVHPAVDRYTYRMNDKVGRFKAIQDRAKDLPRVDVFRKEESVKAFSNGASYGYTHQEVIAARYQGMPLQEQKISAVRRAYEEDVNNVALFGNSSLGVEGFFNNSNVDKLNITQTWISTTATPDEMLKILNTATSYSVKNSKMIERPNTIALAFEDYDILATTPRTSTDSVSVLEYYLKTHDYITEIIPVNELDDYAGANRNRMIVYNRDPEKLKLMISQPLEFFPPQREQMEYNVAAHYRIVGTVTFYPKSITYIDQTP